MLLLLQPVRLDNIKTDLKGTECDSIHLARVEWQALVNTAVNLRVANKGEEFLEYVVEYSFLEKETLVHGVLCASLLSSLSFL